MSGGGGCRRCYRSLVGACLLAWTIAGCGVDQKSIAARDAALAKVQTPWKLMYPGGGYGTITLSASESTALLAAFHDSQPIDWQLQSRIQYTLNGGQPVQVSVMEQSVFKIWETNDTGPGYFRSNQDLLGLLHQIARRAANSAETPHP